MAHDQPKQVIAVTGANGFIASHIIQQLLADTEHDVRGSVRSLSNTARHGFLQEFSGASERLKLYEADLMKYGSFDEMMTGVDVCLHCASPFFTDPKEDAQKELLDPAVNGTTTVLTSCKKAGVKEVIVTSSLAAATECPIPGRPVNDQDWNNDSKPNRNPYYLSKVLAEKAAWEFHRQECKPFKLTILNPVIVWGPSFNNQLNSSVDIIHQITTGKFPAIVDFSWPIVDVRDVARGHVRAINNASVEGKRTFLHNSHIHMREVLGIMKKEFPNFYYPRFNAPSFLLKLGSYAMGQGTGAYIRANVGKGDFVVDNDRSKKELGLEYMPLEQTILDTVKDLQKWRHIPN